MALDDDAVETEKNAAVGPARIHLLPQLPERRTREQVADPGAERAAHGAPEVFANLARRALGGFQRDIAGKALGHDDVDRALADVVALDKAEILEAGQFFVAQHAAGFAHLFEAFRFLDADIEKADARPFDAEQDARGRGTHHRQIDEMLGVGADRGADIEHDRLPAQGRPQRRDRRPLDARQCLEIEFRHRHQRAGIAARHHHVGIAFLHRIDGEPHRGLPAPVAQRLARLILHADGNLGVDDARGGFERGPRLHQRSDQRRVAEEPELAFGMARQSQIGAGDDHGRTVVSPHRIERNADLVWHRSTLRPYVLGVWLCDRRGE